MSTLQERMEVFQRETKMTIGEIAAEAKVTSSAVSQWFGRGNKLVKSIRDIRAAIYLERKTGFSALWLAQGEGPERVAPPDGGSVVVTALTPGRPWPLDPALYDRLTALGERWHGHIEISLDEAIRTCEERAGKERVA
jgi:AcrR family transcriptional regulator